MHIPLEPSLAAAVITLGILAVAAWRGWQDARAQPGVSAWRWAALALTTLLAERTVILIWGLAHGHAPDMWASIAWLVIAGLLAAGVARLGEVLRDTQAEHQTLAARVAELEQLVARLGNPLTVGEVLTDETGQPVDFRYVMVNEAAVRALGHPREELLTKTCRQLFPEVEAVWFALYARVVASGDSVVTESHTRGSDRHYQMVVFRPTPGRFAALTTDITDSRRQADTLRRNEERLRAALDDLEVAVIIADTLGHAVLLNRAAARLTGWPLTAGLGRRVSEIFHARDAETRTPLPNLLRQVLADGQPAVLARPVILVRQDGVEQRIKASVLPVRLSDGTLLAGMVVFEELPAAPASAAGAPPPTEAFRQLADLATEGLAVWQNERLQYANAAFAASVGSTIEELLGREFNSLIEPRDRTVALAGLFAAAGRDELPPRTEFQVTTPGGLTRTLRWRWGRVTWQGRPAVLALTSEVAARPGAGTDGERSRGFASSGAAAGAAADGSPATAPASAGGLTMARLTHDLNNHLCGIQGFAELLANTLADNEQKEHADAIVQSVHRAVDLVRQAQSSGRSDATGMPLREVPPPAILPPTAPPPLPTPPAPPASSIGTGARVLLVDDDAVVREVGAQVLRRAHFQVVTCPDGRAALDYYTHHWAEIDVVLLDLLMPDLDGRQALAAMRRINPHLRALFTSGLGGADTAESATIDGALGMVSKPFTAADLTRAITTALAVDLAK